MGYTTKLFNFGWFPRPGCWCSDGAWCFHFKAGSAFEWTADRMSFRTRSFYLTLFTRTFFLDVNWPVRGNRINGVPE